MRWNAPPTPHPRIPRRFPWLSWLIGGLLGILTVLVGAELILILWR